MRLIGAKDGGFLLWLDDSLGYGTDFNVFLKTLEVFFQRMLEKQIRLNAKKCDLMQHLLFGVDA